MAIEYVTEPGPLLTAAALGVMAPPLKGFVVFVGAQVTGASLSYKDAAQDLDFGSGFGVHAGLMLGSSLGLLVNYDKNTLGSSTGDTELAQWDLLGRLRFIGVGEGIDDLQPFRARDFVDALFE